MGDDAVVRKRAHTDLGDYEEDILVEILARLPVKSLIRFRCVCKPWHALISQPYFVKKHLSLAKTHKLNFDMNPPLFLDLTASRVFNTKDEVWSAVAELDFPVSNTIPESGCGSVVGSCDGLVCVEGSFRRVKYILLWNPCSRVFKVLPNPPLVVELKDRYYKLNGFGYDYASDDYKIVRGFSYDDNGCKKLLIQIFGLKTGFWRSVDVDFVELTKMQGVFSNGALHWFEDLPDGDTRIVSFDLGVEKFQQTVPLPYDDWFTDILIHRNCLCVCTRPAQSDSIHIWMMKEYGVKESWTELMQLSQENFVLDDDDFRHLVRPVCIFENGVVSIDRVGHREIDCCERLMLLSNPREKTFEHIVEVMQDAEISTFIYQETLVSP